MTTITFDTLAYVKTLRDAGVEEKQAEAQASALATVLKGHNESVATKSDIHDLKRDIEVLRLETKKDSAETKAELVNRLIAGAPTPYLIQRSQFAGESIPPNHFSTWITDSALCPNSLSVLSLRDRTKSSKVLN